MPVLNPYLILSGKCRQQMQYYKTVFGGELQIKTFGDLQGAACPVGLKDNVMHASLTNGDFLLMGSDGNPEEKAIPGCDVQLALNFSSVAELNTIFKKMSDGGTVFQEPLDMPWGTFGALSDRYGLRWMFNFNKK